MTKDIRTIQLSDKELKHIIENLFFYGTTYSENYKPEIERKNRGIIEKIYKQVPEIKKQVAEIRANLQW